MGSPIVKVPGLYVALKRGGGILVVDSNLAQGIFLYHFVKAKVWYLAMKR